VMRGDSAFLAFVANTLIDQLFHALNEFGGGESASGFDGATGRRSTTLPMPSSTRRRRRSGNASSRLRFASSFALPVESSESVMNGCILA
jgi:hypothetical protein